MVKKNAIRGLNWIADEELGHRKRKSSGVSTRRDLSDKALDFFKRNHNVIEYTKQRNGKWTVKYRK